MPTQMLPARGEHKAEFGIPADVVVPCSTAKLMKVAMCGGGKNSKL